MFLRLRNATPYEDEDEESVQSRQVRIISDTCMFIMSTILAAILYLHVYDMPIYYDYN